MDEELWILTSTTGFSGELPRGFKPETYTPSTGGQVTLQRAYGSTKVYQTSDSIGQPGAIRLKGVLAARSEALLHTELAKWAEAAKGAVALTRTGASWPTWTLIPGCSYLEAEVMAKSKWANVTFVLVPDAVSNIRTIFGGE